MPPQKRHTAAPTGRDSTYPAAIPVQTKPTSSDLSLNASDICLQIGGGAELGGYFDSNVAVVPADAIRETLH